MHDDKPKINNLVQKHNKHKSKRHVLRKRANRRKESEELRTSYRGTSISELQGPEEDLYSDE